MAYLFLPLYGKISHLVLLPMVIAFWFMVRVDHAALVAYLIQFRLDLYGRGYSDAPQTTYDSTLYTTQLALLMQYLKWEKANIIGVSMGGAIAAAFTAQFPHLVDESVGLIASAGLMEVSHGPSLRQCLISVLITFQSQSSEISRTVKFMSSPLVQILAASRPIRVRLFFCSVKKINDPFLIIVLYSTASK